MPINDPAQSIPEWVLLSYRLPREPSTPRIALWRRLKRLGAVQLGDGLAALPAEPRTREQFEWLAEEAVDSGGNATVWLARPTTAAQQQSLVEAMAAARAAEYLKLVAAAADAASDPASGRRALRRLRRHWREVTRRDFFPPLERQQAAAALQDLADRVQAPDADSAARYRFDDLHGLPGRPR